MHPILLLLTPILIGPWYFKGTSFTLPFLLDTVKSSSLVLVIKSNPDIEIIIRGDQNTSYQSIAELLSVLQANGANNFSLATQPWFDG